MSLKDWIKKLTGSPAVDLKPAPLEIQPTMNARQVRNAMRVARIKAAIAAGDRRPELLDELIKREGR